ncbi:TetR/AcrR family transcriptional regulator [Paraburkholderia azotifigens]|uniref:TetR/AcrR family transcriptional regulator n=1 Tax=Paraburkholderia azotifigens TaxID=2057004 RepID=A0A5C6V7J2_9BURK|nr:TetR/AcrR family transcriptional regulator [Paraburkholderia azotifigens]TXC79725.1 TetR/AcrR family transcriptional regulator [Paraburkholderia azotifigens]
MKRTDDTDSETRGSADIWLDAAYSSLLDGGVEAVRILPLAKKLNLSRTSFYWFFEDRDELLAALLTRWKMKNSGAWIARTEAYAENICEGVLNVFDCWFDDTLFDSRFEAAVRSWTIQDPEVAKEISIDDTRRIDALVRMFVRFRYKPLAAEVRARTMYLSQLGYISLHVTEDISLRLGRIAEYVEVFTGQRPDKHELGRFFARHPVKPSPKSRKHRS